MFEHVFRVGAFETMTALSELLNSQPITARQAAEIATREGIHLPYGTIAGYWSGRHRRPTPATLDNLAKVIPSLSLNRLQEAAWKTPAPLGLYRPPKESVHLTEQQRRALDELIKSVVAPIGDRSLLLSNDVEATEFADWRDDGGEVEHGDKGA